MGSFNASSLAALTAPPAFGGVSKFSSSLQQVLARATGIASLPLQSLQAHLNELGSRQSALQGIETAFLSLQHSIGGIQSAAQSTLLNSSVSNGGIVSATLAQGAAAGVYSIEVDDLGAYSTALSAAGSTAVTDPATQGITDTASVTLHVGGVDTAITADSASLSDLAAAINAQAGDQVQATIVNVGSSGAADYRLSLRAVKLGNVAIGLSDSHGTDLIASSDAGSLASYKVGGFAGAITSESRTVTLGPGLTVNLVGESTPGDFTTITVRNDVSGLTSAFSAFAQAYNNAADALSSQHGVNGGALQGDSLLGTLSNVLSQLGGYTTGSPQQALANFGITVDKSGHLSVDTGVLASAANANFGSFVATVGSSAGGFLKSATDLLDGLEDPIHGVIRSEENALSGQITAQQTKIQNQQAALDVVQTHLTAQIAKADQTIAALESRISFVTGLFAQYTGATNTQSNGLSTL